MFSSLVYYPAVSFQSRGKNAGNFVTNYPETPFHCLKGLKMVNNLTSCNSSPARKNLLTNQQHQPGIFPPCLFMALWHVKDDHLVMFIRPSHLINLIGIVLQLTICLSSCLPKSPWFGTILHISIHISKNQLLSVSKEALHIIMYAFVYLFVECVLLLSHWDARQITWWKQWAWIAWEIQ